MIFESGTTSVTVEHEVKYLEEDPISQLLFDAFEGGRLYSSWLLFLLSFFDLF